MYNENAEPETQTSKNLQLESNKCARWKMASQTLKIGNAQAHFKKTKLWP